MKLRLRCRARFDWKVHVQLKRYRGPDSINEWRSVLVIHMALYKASNLLIVDFYEDTV